MKIRSQEVVNLIMIAAFFGVAAYIYPMLPAAVPSHWDVNGQVNGYMSAFWGAFFVPFLALGLDILFIIIPRIDPKKSNIGKFTHCFDLFVSIMLLFVFYIYALTIFWAFGYRFNMGQLMAPGLAVLFFAVARLVGHAEPNWSIGIRTPWTLSSETVWRKTHKLGGKLFMASAIIILIGMLFPAYVFWFVIVSAILCSAITVLYSYLEYRKIAKK